MADSTDNPLKNGEAPTAPPPPEAGAPAETPQPVTIEIDPSQVVSALLQLLPAGLQELAKMGAQKSRQEHERLMQLDRLYSDERRLAKKFDTVGALVALSLAAIGLTGLLWAVHEQLVTVSNAVTAGAVLTALWQTIRGRQGKRIDSEKPSPR